MQFLSVERLVHQWNQWAPPESSMKQQAQIMDLWGDLLLYLLPIWLSIIIGLVLGWTWKPRWVSLCIMALRSKPRLALTFPPGLGARRLWLAATAAAAAPAVRAIWERFWAWAQKKEMLLAFHHVSWSKQGYSEVEGVSSRRAPESTRTVVNSQQFVEGRRGEAVNVVLEGPRFVTTVPELRDAGESREEEEHAVVDEADLRDLCTRLDERDGGPPWELLMEKRCTGMKYTVWRRDPEVGPTQYRSQSILEACSPELMRDFFWDDEFRIASRWDEMLVTSAVVEEWQESGMQIMQVVRKFPFFCKDREYVIGRRIWSLRDAYFCITKGITHPSVPEKVKPRRVSTFYSSWRIRGVENGGCEVLLFHAEDMGIPKGIAKMGVRQGIWPAVRRVEPGVRLYQRQREGGFPMSRSASMASIHTPIPLLAPPELAGVWRSVSDYFVRGSGTDSSDGDGEEAGPRDGEGWGEEGGGEGKQQGAGRQGQGLAGECVLAAGAVGAVGEEQKRRTRRGKVGWVVAGGLVAVACSVHTTLFLKVVLVGAVHNQVQKKLNERK